MQEAVEAVPLSYVYSQICHMLKLQKSRSKLVGIQLDIPHSLIIENDPKKPESHGLMASFLHLEGTRKEVHSPCSEEKSTIEFDEGNQNQTHRP